MEVVAHKIQNLGAVVVCLDSHATSRAVTEAIRVDLQEGSSGEAANRAKLKLEVDGVIAHGLTLSRHEGQFHLPTESGGGFSEAGHC